MVFHNNLNFPSFWITKMQKLLELHTKNKKEL